jgi:hypothetical protein
MEVYEEDKTYNLGIEEFLSLYEKIFVKKEMTIGNKLVHFYM